MRCSFLFAAVAVVTFTTPASAQLTLEQQRELNSIGTDLQRVSLYLGQLKPVEAEKLVDSVETRLAKLVQDTRTPPNDPTLVTLQTAIAQQRQAIAQVKKVAGVVPQQGQMPAQATVSFVKHIAPIFEKRCISCHSGEDPKGALRLDTYNAIANGGSNGPVIAAGNANTSPLAQRLVARGKLRMPKAAKPLTKPEIRAIATWINEGAQFDGVDPAASISAKAEQAPAGDVMAVAKPTGNETVSFTRDVAPFMANICLRCHSGAEPRGGLSLENFANLMKGGDSGAVIVAGNPEESRLFRLVGGLELPRMPQGEARITRQNLDDLRTWIKEGAKFDGPDAATPLRELAPDKSTLIAARLASMSPAELAKLRTERSQEQWKRVLPKEEPQTLETDEFLLLGNVSKSRLKQIADWGNERLVALNSMLPADRKPLFPGRLAVFVMKDRYSYNEFNLVIEKREAPAEMTAHSNASPPFENAYLVLQDTGEATVDSPGTQLQLGTQLALARLRSAGGDLPDWLEQGVALTVAAQSLPPNPYLQAGKARVPTILAGVAEPTAIFADGTFPPADAGVVGASMVEFLVATGGRERLLELVQAMQQGTDCATALKNVYGTEPAAIARAYGSWPQLQK